MLEPVRRWLSFGFALAVGAGVAFGCAGLGNAASGDKIRIFAHGEHVSGGVSFVYRVENRGTGNVQSFTIGAGGTPMPGREEMGAYALTTPPVGWGTAFDDTEWANPIVPPTTVTSPGGWKGFPSGPLLMGDEASESEVDPRLAFVWEMVGLDDGNPSAGIAPGQTLSGFRILAPRYDITYITSNYSVSTTDGLAVLAPLEKSDTANPSLSVRMSPSSVSKASGTSLKVQAILTVTDDYDPKPEIKLESITASVPMNQSEIKDAKFGTDDRLFILPVKKDPTGKPVVYTVTYSAMDGTGNKATASATVMLNP